MILILVSKLRFRDMPNPIRLVLEVQNNKMMQLLAFVKDNFKEKH